MHLSYTRILACTAVCLLGLCIPSQAAWLYDGSPIYNYGPAIGKDRTTDMVAQPFGFTRPVHVERIGVAIAGGPDPNNAGFRLTLSESLQDFGSTSLGSWSIYPVDGTNLAFSYLDIAPVALEPNRFYYLVVAPGDPEFVGGIAYASWGYRAFATNDDGGRWFEISPLGVRIGGTVVPEPSGLLALGTGILSLAGLIRRRRGGNGEWSMVDG
jgi:hypothetical protein